jgi:hypothetical protein
MDKIHLIEPAHSLQTISLKSANQQAWIFTS